jgi:hypothetical protein
MRFIDVLCAFIITHIVASEQQIIFDPEYKFFKTVDFESEIHSSFMEENDLVNFIQFVKDDHLGVLVARLQRREHLDHKVAIVEMGPVEECRLVNRLRVGNPERLPIRVQKICEEKVGVNEFLHSWRQLIINVEVCLIPEGRQPILPPSVLKVILDFHLQFMVQWLLVVQILDSQEEYGEIVAIADVLGELLELLQDLNEVAHDEGEYGHAAKQNEGAHQPLHIASGVVIAEAHRTQRGKCEIEHDDQIFLPRILIETKCVNEHIGAVRRAGVQENFNVIIFDEIMDKLTDN